MEIKILLEGVHHYYEKDGIEYLDDLTSSVALIKTAGQLILIDSGCPTYEKKLLAVFKKYSLKPADIDLIIATHFHPDHTGNNHLFKNAKIFDGKWLIDFKNKLYTRHKRNKGAFLPKGIKLISTPGHTLPHFSAIVKMGNEKIVFAGDAIRPGMLKEDYSPEGEDGPKMIESALKICQIADEIVPGHGPILKKEEIRKIKNNLLELKK